MKLPWRRHANVQAGEAPAKEVPQPEVSGLDNGSGDEENLQREVPQGDPEVAREHIADYLRRKGSNMNFNLGAESGPPDPERCPICGSIKDRDYLTCQRCFESQRRNGPLERGAFSNASRVYQQLIDQMTLGSILNFDGTTNTRPSDPRPGVPPNPSQSDLERHGTKCYEAGFAAGLRQAETRNAIDLRQAKRNAYDDGFAEGQRKAAAFFEKQQLGELDDQMLKDLIQLCHPDRHPESTGRWPLANKVVGKLLDMQRARKK